MSFPPSPIFPIVPVLSLLLTLQASSGLVGDWTFDNPADVAEAMIGNDLVLIGTATPVAGIGAGDGAVDIGIGSHFRCTPDIAPNGGSASYVNEFTIVYDVFLPAASDGQWRSLLQTNNNNANDGDYFLNTSNTLGLGEIAYSSQTLPPDEWYRIVFSADIGSNIDGGAPASSFLSVVTNIAGNTWTFRHNSQELDGRHSLYSTANDNVVFFFADENGEDHLLRVSRVQLYDEALSEAVAQSLGGPSVPDPNNNPPDAPQLTGGVASAETGETAMFSFAATDPDNDEVVISIQWGDGGMDSGVFAPSGTVQLLDHSWATAGDYSVRARARDVHGASSEWVDLQIVSVTGVPVVTFLTPPYLQNLRTDGIVIMTETAEDLALVVSYGETEGFGSTEPMTRVASGGGTWFHRALLTGLTPGTEYHYAVGAPRSEPLTGHAHFHTAPDREIDFKFSAWSDSQGHNRGAWTADRLEPTISMMQHMVASGVAFGLTTGDLAENGGSYSDTRSYYLDRVARHLGTSVPWFAAWGNHDTSNPNSPLRLASDMPSRYRAGLSPGHGSFSFTYSNCFFICMDEFYKNEITNGWLEAQLASPEAQNARFRFLGVHVPPYCERWIDGSSALRTNLVPLLEQYDIDICFSGHTHEYERGELNHVHYVVTGGGSWLDHTEEVVRDWEHMFVGGAHDVNGMWAQESSQGVLGPPQPIVGGLFNEYALITVRDDFLRLDAHGFNADGSEIGVLDSFEIGTDPGPDSDGDGMRDPYELANGLDPNDATGHNGATGDLDGDGQANLAEMIAGTLANDSSSVFELIAAGREVDSLEISWTSVPGKRYQIHTSIDMSSWNTLEDSPGKAVLIEASAGASTSHSVPIPVGASRVFVRVVVAADL